MSDQSPVLAGPPGDCCFQGVRHTGDPVGKRITIAEIPTYISEPPAGTTGSKKVILYFADVYGPFYINAQLIQDYYASQGFHVLGIDYFFGDPVHLHADEPHFDRQAWSTKYRALAKDVTPRWVTAVRDIYGPDSKFSAIGYCFGAPFALDAATRDDFVAAAFAHPSSLNEEHFKNVKKPLLLSCAETDGAFPAGSRRRAEDILCEIKATYLVQIFSGVSHGFATRGDPNNENSRWAKEESARSVISWFKRFSNV